MEPPVKIPTDPTLPPPNLASEDGDIDPQTRLLESAPEADRWNPISGSKGSQLPTVPPLDEYQDGRTLGADLVSEGVREAEHEQISLAENDEQTNE